MSELSLLQLVLGNLALAAGACLQGVAGYGIGTLAAPILFLISPLFIPGPLIMGSILLAVLLLLRNRASLGFRQVRFAIGGNVVGTALAIATLSVIVSEQFDLIFGGLILTAVALSVAGLRPALNARNSVIAGAASGYMGTITAVGGPPIAMIYQNETGPLVRANMSAFFLFASCAAVLGLILSGHLGWEEVKLCLAMLPGIVTGFILSGHVVRKLPFAALRPIILGIAAVAGCAAILRGLL